MPRVAIPVYGMHCAHCVAAVTVALRAVPAVTDVEVLLEPGVARVAGTAPQAALQRAIVAAGYALAAGDLADASPDTGMADVAATLLRAPDAARGVVLRISGMTCAACVATVENALQAVPGVSAASVNFADETAWVDGTVAAAALVAAVRGAGYDGALIAAGDDTSGDRAPGARFWRAAIALGVGVALMAVDVTHGLAPGRAHGGVTVAVGVLCLAVMVYSGGHFYRGAWAALRRGTSTMDSLIATGTGAAWLYSMSAVLWPAGVGHAPAHTYFDSALMILGFVNLGQGLELRARRRTSRAIRALLDLAPVQALLVSGDSERSVPLAQVQVGHWLRVRAGERVPVDGVVIDGVSDVDEALLTGEPMPVMKHAGDTVTAGAVNGAGSILIEAQRVGEATALARIIALVRRAQNAKPELGRLADRIAAVFVPIVFALAVATALLWWGFGPAPKAHFVVTTALTVLIIACPCALGLATPLSIMVAVGRAARLGVLIRDGQAFEHAARLTTIIVDKTGTLTRGRPRVRDVHCAAGIDPASVLQSAAALESGSLHPIARAIRDAAASDDAADDSAMSAVAESGTPVAFRETAGEGVAATLNGQAYRLGNERFMARWDVALPPAAPLATAVAEGATLAYLARDGRWLATIVIGDALRPDSAAAVRKLHRAGIRVVLLSGDGADTVAAMGALAGVDEAHGALSPAAKAEFVGALQARGEVVGMVGDGINDAPALAAADVGMAIGDGADAAIESADVTLLRPSLDAAGDAVLLARATLRNIRQNLFFAFFYNVLAIPLAAGAFYPWTGWLLDPMVGSAAMALSSLTVVGNALRLRRLALAHEPA